MDINEQQECFRRYLAGTASAKEREWVEAWYAAFDQLPDHTVAAKATDAKKQIIYQKISQRIEGRSWMYSWTKWAVAACALLALGVLIWQLNQRPGLGGVPDTIVSTAAGERRSIRLNDSSVIWLNGGSQLRYTADYGKHKREIWLEKGEVFFDVTPNTRMPFVVNAHALQVKVLGTSFNVDAFPNQDVAIGVRSGKVQVSHAEQVLGTLGMGDQLYFRRNKGVASLSRMDAKWIASWQQNKMELENVDFKTLRQTIAEFYGVPLRSIGKGLDDYRFTLVLDRAVSIEETLEIIAAIHQIGYRKETDGTITIYPSTP